MKSFKEIIGAEPQQNEDGTYNPSKSSLAIATSKKTNYDYTVYENAYTGDDKKILVLCTEDGFLECENGRLFNTGNHPVETFVVLLHLEQAGFLLDFATLTGRPVKIEEWAIPEEDEAVLSMMSRYAPQLEFPLSMLDVYNNLNDNSNYYAVYIPGGHGALIDLPFSEDTKSILQWFLDQDKHIITICHGPAALLSLTLNEDPDNFPFKDYKIQAFPDSSDTMMEAVGYLPGKLIWHFGEKLKGLGVHILSLGPIGETHIDRKLISGDSPAAANKLGKLAAETLLASLQQ